MIIETFIQILISSLVATSVMTLFSYIISESFRELYKEPVLLSYCLTALAISLSAKTKNVLGWIIHYAIGFLFVFGYYLLWENEIISETWIAAFILGAISGIIGILSWVIIFKISDYNPKIDFKGYYLQLFFVHVIFGLSAFAVYTLF
ncbi:hypothetical protein ABS764_12920 [Flavobacterium sp. ST-87]|uniref:Uncharacterized protein n=1 Tax=Flavobacterium plantiphilum TaxID=3163297 RepID=A0ABW8XXD0_9FLAO